MVNHGVGAKLATDLLLSKSLGRLFRTEISLCERKVASMVLKVTSVGN